MGRQSTYSEDAANAICERIAEGEPLRQICRDEGMPSWRSVYRWMDAHPDFASHIAHARILGFDAIAQDALEISDDARNDYMDRVSRDGESVERIYDAEHVQRSKLRIETRLKLLSKWDPKRYGEKTEVAHTGNVTVEMMRFSDGA